MPLPNELLITFSDFDLLGTQHRLYLSIQWKKKHKRPIGLIEISDIIFKSATKLQT